MSVADKLRARKGSNTTSRVHPAGSNTTEQKPAVTRETEQETRKGSNTTEKKERENKFGNLLKELQSQLALFNERISALEGSRSVPKPAFEITEETILKYSKWVLQQDPEIVPKTIKNAIVKNYRRPAEDYARSFVDFLKKEGILKPEV